MHLNDPAKTIALNPVNVRLPDLTRVRVTGLQSQPQYVVCPCLSTVLILMHLWVEKNRESCSKHLVMIRSNRLEFLYLLHIRCISEYTRLVSRGVSLHVHVYVHLDTVAHFPLLLLPLSIRHNGKWAQIKGFDSDSGRYFVQIDASGNQLKLKRENVIL